MDFTTNFFQATGTIQFTSEGLMAQDIPAYTCPSDVGGGLAVAGAKYQRVRGNYAVNWGNAYCYTKNTTAKPEPAGGLAPFSHRDLRVDQPSSSTFGTMTDGSSNTLLMAELLKAATESDSDWRGDVHNDQGTFRFQTLLQPNSSLPDRLGFLTEQNDPLMPGIRVGGPQLNGARSRHPGGVSVAFCEASIHCIANGIEGGVDASGEPFGVWPALGTMNGGEVVSGF